MDTTQQTTIGFYMDRGDGHRTPRLHVLTCATATSMGPSGDARWARIALTNRDAVGCACLIADKH